MEIQSSSLLDPSNNLLKKIENELGLIKDKEKRNRVIRFIVAAMSSIPWIGGFFSASASLSAEKEQAKSNELFNLWLKEHESKISLLGETIEQILYRFDAFGNQIQARLESEEYLSIVKKGFRLWDKSDTFEKREIIRKLITNAAVTNISSDDVIRLFMDWIEKYHDSHFYVIKYIYNNPGITRGRIWDMIYDIRPLESSAEADLFKLLIRDLSTGGVIRQHRQTNYYGEFIKKKTTKKSRSQGKTMKSAFDDEDPYELTELGSKFVHYCLEEAVPQIDQGIS